MRTLLFVLFTIALATSAQARLIQSLTFQEAYDRADLVVVARPVSVTDLTERISFQDLIDGIASSHPEVDRTNLIFAGVETVFSVQTVVKGEKPAGNRFALHHYRHPTEALRVMSPPFLVTFDPAQPRSYLLLLKKETDGRFTPISGQVDPALGALVSADRFDAIVIGKPVAAEVKTNTITAIDVQRTRETIPGEAQIAVEQVIWGSETMSEIAFHFYSDYKIEPGKRYVLVLKKESTGRYVACRKDWPPKEKSWGVARLASPEK